MFCKSSILSFYLYFLSFLLVCLSSSHTVLWVIRPQPRTLAAREAPLGFFFFFLQLIIQSWRFHLWRWCPFATWLNNWISQQQQWEREFVFGLAISQNNSPEAETEMMRTGEENGEKKKKQMHADSVRRHTCLAVYEIIKMEHWGHALFRVKASCVSVALKD